MKRRKYLLILIGLLGMIQIHAQKSVAFKADNEAPQPQWIGAITDEDAHIPSNRDYVGTGTVNAKGKPDWKATAPLSRQSIWMKKEMKLPADVYKATMKIVGLGFYELSINRQKVTDAVFAPLWSDYDKTVFYNIYDVTALLKKGKNQLSVLLGNGFYNEQGGRYTKMKVSYGPPTLYCSLEIELKNGRTVCIVSDGSWKYSPSSITFNSIYGGEDEDARITSSWKPVVIQSWVSTRCFRVSALASYFLAKS
jgi:alpha-L-rhamnosidase